MLFRFSRVLCTALILTAFHEELFSEEFSARENHSISQVKEIATKIIRQIEIPKGYHEGLLLSGGEIWVNNGEEGETWVIDVSTGTKLRDIKPIGSFSEGISWVSGNKYWVTDWREGALYLVHISADITIAEKEYRLGQMYPAGVVWTGQYIFVILWGRGPEGTYDILKMDGEGNIIRVDRLKEINEPSQLTWDGKNLWITSWCDKKAYKLDPDTYEILGFFETPMNDATGIAWDGKSFWITGTRSDLYQVELVE
ncbi:MAG TPA: hypothetical protein PKY78_00400 [Candidatus Omnitrophota bacterium]|nr:hypothetical protein [Candidatus Omnitrophota bacterium]HPS19436.1 hypothetical protein [Candidatus Omnitrophota bacterium]